MAHVVGVAESLGLQHRSDGAGNLCVYRPADPGVSDPSPVAIQTHLDMVTEAHTMAQRGVESVYESAQDETTKVAAVLSALAVALAKSEADVRRGDAFMGRVQLPFLATRARPGVESVLMYSEDCDAWCMLRRSAGGVAVASKRHGVAGLEALVVRMSLERSARRFV